MHISLFIYKIPEIGWPGITYYNYMTSNLLIVTLLVSIGHYVSMSHLAYNGYRNIYGRKIVKFSTSTLHKEPYNIIAFLKIN